MLLVDEGEENGGLLDFVDCRRDGRPIEPEDIRIVSTTVGFRARFQNGDAAWQLDHEGKVSEMPSFYLA